MFLSLNARTNVQGPVLKNKPRFFPLFLPQPPRLPLPPLYFFLFFWGVGGWGGWGDALSSRCLFRSLSLTVCMSFSGVGAAEVGPSQRVAVPWGAVPWQEAEHGHRSVAKCSLLSLYCDRKLNMVTGQWLSVLCCLCTVTGSWTWSRVSGWVFFAVSVLWQEAEHGHGSVAECSLLSLYCDRKLNMVTGQWLSVLCCLCTVTGSWTWSRVSGWVFFAVSVLWQEAEHGHGSVAKCSLLSLYCDRKLNMVTGQWLSVLCCLCTVTGSWTWSRVSG